jgi:hypothetical protein
MDLRVFYQKMRQVEASLEEPHVVVISLETSDGGRAGVPAEVSKGVAARLIVEGKARLATAEETTAFRNQAAEAKLTAEQLAAAGRMQITVLSEADVRTLKGISKKG